MHDQVQDFRKRLYQEQLDDALDAKQSEGSLRKCEEGGHTLSCDSSQWFCCE